MPQYINKVVVLSPDEMVDLSIIADKRCNKKNLTKTWSKGNTRNDKNLHGHLLGVIGEYVCANEFGGEFDRNIYGKEGDKHEPDIIAGNKTYEVKSTHYWPPILKITRKQELAENTQEIILCHIDIKKRKVTIMGSITVDEFWKSCYTSNFGYGTRHCYEFKEPEETILEFTETLLTG